MQAKISLRNANITAQSTKADTILANVDVEVLSCVRDIITTTPAPADIFDEIKERIIRTFAISSEVQLRQLLKGQVHTDGKPSLILSRLRNFNSAKCNDAVIKAIFMDQLPAIHRAILVATGGDDLDRLAGVADELADSASLFSGGKQISASSRVSGNPLEKEVQSLSETVAALSAKIDKLVDNRNREKSRSRSRSRSRDRPNKPSLSNSPGLCR